MAAYLSPLSVLVCPTFLSFPPQGFGTCRAFSQAAAFHLPGFSFSLWRGLCLSPGERRALWLYTGGCHTRICWKLKRARPCNSTDALRQGDGQATVQGCGGQGGVPSRRSPDPVRVLSTIRCGRGIVEAFPSFLSHTLPLNPSSLPFSFWTRVSYVFQAGFELSIFLSLLPGADITSVHHTSISVKAFLKGQRRSPRKKQGSRGRGLSQDHLGA